MSIKPSSFATEPLTQFLTVSKVLNIHVPNAGSTDRRPTQIDHVVASAYLSGADSPFPFEQRIDRDWGSFRLRYYEAAVRVSDIGAQLLGKTAQATEKESLIFLYGNKSTTTPVIVLSTNRAYQAIKRFCSDSFPKKIDQYLSSQEGKTNGCGKNHPKVLEKNNVQFKKRGITILKPLTLEQYKGAGKEFLFEDNRLEIGSDEALEPCPDQLPLDYQEREALDQLLTACLIGTASVKDEGFVLSSADSKEEQMQYKPKFSISGSWVTKASNIKLLLPELGTKWKIQDLEESRPSFEAIIKGLEKGYGHCYRFNKEQLWKVFLSGKIQLLYQIKGIWYTRPLIDSLSGQLETAQEEVRYKKGKHWYKPNDK